MTEEYVRHCYRIVSATDLECQPHIVGGPM